MEGQGFLDVLRTDMASLTSAEDMLRRCVEATDKTGLAATMTLTLKVHRLKNSDEGRVYVTASLAERMPKPAGRDRLFFVGDDGNLTRRDPRAPELPGLAAVEITDAPPVDAETTDARPRPATHEQQEA